MIRTLCCAIALLLTLAQVTEADEALVPRPSSSGVAASEHARTIKTAGIALAVTGTVFSIAGAILMRFEDYYIGRDDSMNPLFPAGPTLLAIGGTMIPTGISLWVTGAAKEHRAEARLSASGLVVHF